MSDYTPRFKDILRAARGFTVDGKILSRRTANGTLKDAGLAKAF